MGIFKKLFGKNKQPQNHSQEDYTIKKEKLKTLLQSTLTHYYKSSCQCAYPRFHQLSSIDCTDSGNSFKCLDTDLLINLVKPYFEISDITDLKTKGEIVSQSWTCKKCGSIYEYGWSDFSIHIERQKLKVKTLKTKTTGKQVTKTTPLYLGLIGHSYPSQELMSQVSLEEMKSFLEEK